MTAPRTLRDDDVAAIASRTPLVLLLDIDGTLAPIAPTPQDAGVPEGTKQVLRRLVVLPDVHIALVTGRRTDDALAMVGVHEVWVVGTHGAELLAPDGRHETDPLVAAHEGAVARAARALERDLAPIPGALVEDKRWSVVAHTRLASRGDVATVERIARAAADREGLRVTVGKEVFELRAPVDVDKGTASLALLGRLGAQPERAGILYAGDDTTDEDAFRRLGERLPNAVTIRVGAPPPDTTTAAKIVVDDPAAVRTLLERIANARTVPSRAAAS
jgi:trehalose 6-phosphate phosphatase